MKKILYSGGVIVFIAAIAIGATGAFFSDSETSTGNTFTAGAVDLKIDSVQHYNGMICVDGGDGYVWAPAENVTLDLDNQPVLTPYDVQAYIAAHPFGYPVAGSTCDGTWALTDLEDGVHQFWNFTDVKPGDEGENTISLHIDNNPAWACIDVVLTKNDDVTCNDPELGDDASCTDPGVPGNSDAFDGELAQNLKFAAWADDGDNVWEEDEPLLFSNKSGPASDVLGGKTYALADSVTGPLPGGSTSYIGLAWCAGNQVVDEDDNIITCDGAGMNNAAQTDSMQANVTFRVEQHRNNPSFLCDPETAPEATTLTLEKVIQQDGVDVVTEALWTLTATGPVVISGIETAPAVTAAPVPAGDYVLTENVVAGFTQSNLQCVGGGSCG